MIFRGEMAIRNLRDILAQLQINKRENSRAINSSERHKSEAWKNTKQSWNNIDYLLHSDAQVSIGPTELAAALRPHCDWFRLQLTSTSKTLATTFPQQIGRSVAIWKENR